MQEQRVSLLFELQGH